MPPDPTCDSMATSSHAHYYPIHPPYSHSHSHHPLYPHYPPSPHSPQCPLSPHAPSFVASSTRAAYGPFTAWPDAVAPPPPAQHDHAATPTPYAAHGHSSALLLPYTQSGPPSDLASTPAPAPTLAPAPTPASASAWPPAYSRPTLSDWTHAVDSAPIDNHHQHHNHDHDLTHNYPRHAIYHTPIQHPFPNHIHPIVPITSSLSRSQTSPVHVDALAALQSSAAAAWDSTSELVTAGHHHFAAHTNNTLNSVLTTVDHVSAPIDRQWPGPHMPADQDVYGHHNGALISPTNVSLLHLPNSSHKSAPKKKAAKIPSSFVERQEKMKVSKRKGPLQEKQREKTHIMRKTKRICVRCRFYKSGCDEGDPCQKCDKIEGHARSFREPCYREHLEDTSIVRHCNGREHQHVAEFLAYDWKPGSQLWEMDILWNLPGYGRISNAQPMRIMFRAYSPRRGSLDTATSVWSTTEGEVRAIEQPAYAIYDTASLVPAFERYFSSLNLAIEAWIFARIQQDEIASLTYREVVRMRGMHNSKVLDLAMRLQCLSVVSQGYGTVWSDNVPGIQAYDYRRLGRSDYEAYDRDSCDRPLPGAITHQMDVAAVKYLRKLEKLFVKELAALIFKPRIKPWYELFLAFYVIFWNLEYINQGAKGYMKSKNGTFLASQVNSVVNNQIKKWEFTFPVLLYHWRCTLRGYSPFKMARDNPAELRENGHIDTEGFEYIARVARLFDSVGPQHLRPPLTGFASTHHSLNSAWITKLFQEAGA